MMAKLQILQFEMSYWRRLIQSCEQQISLDWKVNSIKTFGKLLRIKADVDCSVSFDNKDFFILPKGVVEYFKVKNGTMIHAKRAGKRRNRNVQR